MSTVTGLMCFKGVISYHARTDRQQAVMHRGLRHINLQCERVAIISFHIHHSTLLLATAKVLAQRSCHIGKPAESCQKVRQTHSARIRAMLHLWIP